MDFKRFQTQHNVLDSLLSQCREYSTVSKKIEAFLPQNLRGYYRIACIRHAQLVIYADNNMVANRLRMLLPSFKAEIEQYTGYLDKIVVKLNPVQQTISSSKQLNPSKECLNQLEKTAQKLAQYPELAASMQRFVNNHKIKKS